jgi:hypothetical protein
MADSKKNQEIAGGSALLIAEPSNDAIATQKRE